MSHFIILRNYDWQLDKVDEAFLGNLFLWFDLFYHNWISSFPFMSQGHIVAPPGRVFSPIGFSTPFTVKCFLVLPELRSKRPFSTNAHCQALKFAHHLPLAPLGYKDFRDKGLLLSEFLVTAWTCCNNNKYILSR